MPAQITSPQHPTPNQSTVGIPTVQGATQMTRTEEDNLVTEEDVVHDRISELAVRASKAHGELSAFMWSVFVMTAGEKEDLKQLLTWHLQQTGDRSAVILRAAMRFIDSVED